MQKRAATAVAIIAALAWAPIAVAQTPAPKTTPSRVPDDLEIKIRVPGDVIREVNRIVDAVTGSELQRELSEALRDVTDQIASIDGRQVGDEIRAAMRDATRGLAHAAGAMSDSLTIDGQGRNLTARQRDREVKTFQIGASGQLSLDNILGDITITAGTGRDVTVEIVREARGRTDADARLGLERVRVETTERGGGRVSLKTTYQNDNHSNYAVDVRYTVTAPAGTQVSAHSVSGNVSATGMRGELSLLTISGNVVATHAARLSDARTTSGNITLTDVESDGTLSAVSMNGTVTAQQVKAPRLDLGSISGDIIAREVTCENGQLHTLTGQTEFSGPLARRGRYQFTTHSGNVRIITDGKVGFALEGSSFSGTLNSDFPMQSVGNRIARRTMNGTYGDGSALILVSSFSGNVSLIKK